MISIKKTKIFPEVWIVFIGFLLNFLWEMLQAPLFQNMIDSPYWATTKHCIKATFGDVLILLIIYWTISIFSVKKRFWITEPLKLEITCFIALGLIITIVFEILAIKSLNLWQYSELMPRVFSIGLAPILQWIVLPLFLFVFLKRIYPSSPPHSY